MTRGSGAALSPARLLGVWERVRTSFWLVPALMTVAAGALSYATVALDRRLGSEAMGTLGWVWSGGASGARSVLSTIAGSMATVAGVVFSVNIVALTLASSQFGPRLLRNFTRDLGNQLVLGTFISTFLYCLLVLRTVRGADEGGFVPEVSVTCAVLLAVASVGVLIYFIGHVAEAIQAESLIAAVGQELREQIVGQYGEGPVRDVGNPGRMLPHEAELPGGTPSPVRAGAGGYVQGIAHDDLAAAAAGLGAVVQVLHRPGDFVLAGEPLALVHGTARPLDEDADAREAETGDHRVGPEGPARDVPAPYDVPEHRDEARPQRGARPTQHGGLVGDHRGDPDEARQGEHHEEARRRHEHHPHRVMLPRRRAWSGAPRHRREHRPSLLPAPHADPTSAVTPRRRPPRPAPPRRRPSPR